VSARVGRRDKPASTLKTYSHLGRDRRKPDDYEIATTDLLYYPAKGGFEVEVPLDAWYRRHQRESPLGLASDLRFADPRRTTYASYVAVQRDRETALDALFETIEKTGSDAGLSPAWLDALDLVLPVLRYPGHALSMLAAYVGQMSASGRVVVCATMQAADEVRRVQRLAYRMVALRRTRPGFGARARDTWEKDPRWQPLRELVERALVTWDANEALIALCLCIKPPFDELFGVFWPELASAAGDPLLAPLAASFHEDALWHRAWSSALVSSLVAEDAARRAAAQRWVDAWAPRTIDALAALDGIFAPASFAGRLRDFTRGHLESARLELR
jgi:toluene monooxygenase system protein E